MSLRATAKQSSNNLGIASSSYTLLAMTYFSASFLTDGWFCPKEFGLHFELSKHYMQKMKSFLSALLFLIIISVAGISIGFVIGVGINTLYGEGLFTSWQQVESSLKFNQIVDLNYQTIWVETVDGKLYSWNFNCHRDEPCNEWFEIDKLPSNIHDLFEQIAIESAPCKICDFRPYRKPPKNVLQCAESAVFGVEGSIYVFFVLLADGTIWVSHFTSWGVYSKVLLLFSLIGLILGLVAFVRFVKRRRTKQTK